MKFISLHILSIHSMMLRLAASSKVVPNALRAVLSQTNIISGSTSAASKPKYFSTNTAEEGPLVKAVKSAIKSKQSSMNQNVPGDFPFTIEDNPYEISKLNLRRVVFEEEIFVSVEKPKPRSYDESCFWCRECGSILHLHLNVRITKKSGKMLDFGVSISVRKMIVTTMSVIEPSSDDHPLLCFGPNNVDVKVSSELQSALEEYVETRGIRKCDTFFLFMYMFERSKRQLLVTLEKLANGVD